MFPPNARMDQIEGRNTAMFAAAQEFQQGLKNKTATLADLPKLKQQFPAFGIMPCKAAGIEFVMFHAHDDVVVWEYIWRGEDGYETDLVNTWVKWCARPGTILDIGAYSGLMSILAARANSQNKVHLFEPMERIIERANINVKINGLGQKIIRHAVAASDTTERVKINLYRGEDALGTGSSIHAKEGKTSFGFKEIQAVSIDTYLPDVSPHTIKVDVEGHEMSTLRGMENTIRRANPNMIIEVWEHNRTDFMSFMKDMKYNCVRSEPQDRPVNNYICTPTLRKKIARHFSK